MQREHSSTEIGQMDPADVDGHTIAIRAPHVGYVELDRQGLCYDAISDELYILNPTAAVIWECLDGRASLAEIAADVAVAFSADESMVRDSVLMTVSNFVEKGLVGPPQSAGPTNQLVATPPSVSSPRLLTDPPGG